MNTNPIMRNAARLLGLSLAIMAFGVTAPLEAQEEQDERVPQEFDWWMDRGIPSETPWGQRVDTAATREILTWTTSEEFTNEHVDHLPYDESVISPYDHWGYASGRPGHLHRADELHGYLEALAASSPRVLFEEYGESEEGNPFGLVTVGSEENVARMDEIREAYHQLTDPRETSREEAEELIQDLPVVHLIYTGLHSAETGHPEVPPELAYRLAVSDDPMIERIREGAVLLIVPVTDPDGRNRVVDWYRYHEDWIDEEQSRIPGPPYWGHYVFHDNNRDGLQMSLELYQEMVGVFEEWKPAIAIDLHESVPFLYVSSGTGPYNPNVPEVTRHEWQWISQYEVSSLTALGMPGVWTHDFYTGWNPSYLFWLANNRNAVGRFYETFMHSVPVTMEQSVGPGRTSEEWFRANPPYSEVTWSLRNNTNYAQTGVLHSLHLASTNRERVLRNYWVKNDQAVTQGRKEAPHAWVVPADQARRADVSHMLTTLLDQGIEVHEAGDGGTFGEGDGEVVVEAGDHVVRMDQPYSNFVNNLLAPMDYPEDRPFPYDDTAWNFPLLYRATVEPVDDPGVLDLAMDEVIGTITPGGDVAAEGEEDWWVVRHEASFRLLEAHRALEDVTFHAAREEVELPNGETYGPGSWLISADEVDSDGLESWADEFGLDVVGVTDDAVADVDRHEQPFPEIAVLHTWRRTQDDGWVRIALDELNVPYTYLPVDRLVDTDLQADFDVLIFPEQGTGADGRTIFEGRDPESGRDGEPLPYMPHDDYPTLGFPSSTEDMTGGMGHDGLAALREFVEDGGTLVTLGSATNLPVDMGLVRGVQTWDGDDVIIPGSLLEGTVERPDHPVVWGYEEEFPLFERFGPYLNVGSQRSDNVLVRYGEDADELALSGLAEGVEGVAGRPALLSIPQGDGHMVLFGFRTLHRSLTRGGYAFVWNAILNWNQLDLGLGDPEEVAEDEN